MNRRVSWNFCILITTADTNPSRRRNLCHSISHSSIARSKLLRLGRFSLFSCSRYLSAFSFESNTLLTLLAMIIHTFIVLQLLAPYAIQVWNCYNIMVEVAVILLHYVTL